MSSITPTDHAIFIRSGGIDEAEMLGANGLCIISIYYTSHVLTFVSHTLALIGLESLFLMSFVFAIFRIMSTFRLLQLLLWSGRILLRKIA